MRKIILCFICGAFAMGLVSCMQEDNFDPPAASIRGNIIDATTGVNYLTDQNDVHIRIWERSWSDNPNPQDLVVKMDGSYQNTKLFAGTYNMLPYDGSWWPCDTVFDKPIGNKNNATQDFTVTPYLKIKDFDWELVQTEGAENLDTLVMRGRLFAPITEGLPQVLEVRPFVNINHFCGNANQIDYYHSNTYMKNLRTGWINLGDMDTGEGFETYEFRLPVKKGYHYWFRMGANVNDTNKKFNYSEIKDVVVPQAAE